MAKKSNYKEYSIYPVPDNQKIIELKNVFINKHYMIGRITIDEHSDKWNKLDLDSKIDHYDPTIGGLYWEDFTAESIGELLHYYEDGYTIQDYTGLMPDFLSNDMLYWIEDPETKEQLIITAVNDKFNFVVIGVKNNTNFGISYKDWCVIQFITLKQFEEYESGGTHVSSISDFDWNLIESEAADRNGYISAIKYLDSWYALATIQGR